MINVQELPVFKAKEEIIQTIKENKVTVVVGKTGCGRTTQIPQFIYESGLVNGGIVGITQPRRIAATSVAEFVAKQLGTKPGEIVGYQIRFDDHTADHTKIKFMTDGILLRELQIDPDLKKYSVIMVDEAHERSTNIDFILGLLKDLLKRRNDLKVVVTSGTIDEKKFSRYFWDAPIVNVVGRTYPVEIIYSEYDFGERQMPETVAEKIIEIHKTKKPGDILAFMTGSEEIHRVIKKIQEENFNDLVVLPLYATLSSNEQHKAFDDYPGKRKIIVATNIAETSITIDGIVYVVDSGLIKQTNFHPESGIQSLDLIRHSKAGCDQRAGRAGRTKAGVCYRMYTKENFFSRQKFTTPEILRTSLASVVLTMEYIGIENIENFDFIDMPDKDAFREAYQTLIALGAIKKGKRGLTEIGDFMAKLPLEPKISKMVLEAEKYGCVKEIATVAAFLSAKDVFVRPKDKSREANAIHQKFKNFESDALTFLNVFEGYEDSGRSNNWCYDNFLNAKTLAEVTNIRHQLLKTLENEGIRFNSKGNKEMAAKAVAMGFAYNSYIKNGKYSYASAVRPLSETVFIHPSSSLFSYLPLYMVAAKIIQTTKNFAQTVTKVRPEWLPEILPNFCCLTAQMLKSFDAIKKIGVASQDIVLNDRIIGQITKEVSPEEAKAIQEVWIKKAKEERMILLEFSGLGYEKYADYGDMQYRAANGFSIETGKSYYCKIIQYPYAGGYVAEAVFEVFNLSDDATTTTLETLVEKWGAKLKKN